MQFLNNIPSDFRLTQYFKTFYELYSVKTLPTQLSVDRAFARVLNIVNAKAKQKLLTVAPDRTDTCNSNSDTCRGARVTRLSSLSVAEKIALQQPYELNRKAISQPSYM